MALTKYRLGELIEQRREKYDNNSRLPVRGVCKEGFMDARQPDADLKLYNAFYYGDFVFNPARMELNSIAYNNIYEKAICSSLYEIFYVTRRDIVLPEYLNMFLKRDEFARQCAFLGWGSAREYCRVYNIADVTITLPDIEVQRKYVAVYQALKNNLAVYQSKTDDLKLVCEGYIDKLKRTAPIHKLQDYIEAYDERNTANALSADYVKGISTDKKFIDTKANMLDVSLDSYKIVETHTFAYVPDTSRRGDKMAIAFNSEYNPILISSIYTTFKSKDESKLLPEYLFMFLNRPEFDRYARFHSWGSAREVFTMDDMNEVEIPIPDIKIQQEIVNIHKCYIERQRIAEKLKEEINRLCPILIKGSLQAEN